MSLTHVSAAENYFFARTSNSPQRTLLWPAGSALLSWYLSHFANYTATYGSLGAAIGLMTWMWMPAIIVLCGAELNSEIDAASTGQPAGESAAARA